ncbi:hypothetical protein KFK09_013464 [Dendrobium nobile]|uniref:Uncharacterized protein n=1 Tax=Dendrobium nobile TaxID=94219 RepID=A0A8T3B9P8_DENNO|nr:hypothetical protein KFK09_013464 [Dendrobium nobile]
MLEIALVFFFFSTCFIFHFVFTTIVMFYMIPLIEVVVSPPFVLLSLVEILLCLDFYVFEENCWVRKEELFDRKYLSSQANLTQIGEQITAKWLFAAEICCLQQKYITNSGNMRRNL